MKFLLTRGCVALAVLASSLFLVSPASAAIVFTDPPPPDAISIQLVAMAGSGCAPGTADVAISPDNSAFTAIYSAYLAQAGPGVPVTENRKNCQLNVLVNAPSGYTFAIAKVDYRGYGFLQRGAVAQQRANYYFQGMSMGSYANHPIAAPLDDNWIATDEVPIAAQVFRPCGEQRNLNINTELRVTKGTSTDVSYVTMDSTDGSIETIYHFTWMRCH
ncbi:hypothetical protein ACWT_4695 [Actinoplanes sp. SE50]|uniref:DUF4360 domain-containing protein n=1 Tax=unclassified Actinoplanes TaxID=2626549 RepID=UPI00023EBD83|nr:MULTISPECIES: DUF4360 domain-containing protein [unclassified Actinoplanes]AEV85717.1 hypothetical protein ACPL_4826 [Actinoplanes sp. SE50/110]ATO84110.1 hypothetical protein ACWT_4695 [Actinoplanes sp. SE50]SLM01520.1 hypothetical protein ACSP50_4756 [Actinoplanes sp. SE50/110]